MEQLKEPGGWEAARASERARAPAKYPLCSSLPSLEEPLITVQVKLNMREISRAAGVGGMGGEGSSGVGWGGQSRGASERGKGGREGRWRAFKSWCFVSCLTSPERRQGIGQIKLGGIRVIRETGCPIVKISAVSRIWGIISTLAAYPRGAATCRAVHFCCCCFLTLLQSPSYRFHSPTLSEAPRFPSSGAETKSQVEKQLAAKQCIW